MLNVFSQHAYIGLHIFLILKIHSSWLLYCLYSEGMLVMKKQQSFSFWSFLRKSIVLIDWSPGPVGIEPFCSFEYRMYSGIHWIDCEAHFSFLFPDPNKRAEMYPLRESSCNCLLIVRPSFTWQNSVLTKIYACHEVSDWSTLEGLLTIWCPTLKIWSTSLRWKESCNGEQQMSAAVSWEDFSIILENVKWSGSFLPTFLNF